MLVPSSHDDEALVSLWLSLKQSSHSRRAYSREVARFLNFHSKPIRDLRLPDLSAYIEHLSRSGLSTASQNLALTAVKSLLKFALQTGYVPFNVGAAVRLKPNRDRLAQRILTEAEVVRMMQSTPEGRDQALLRLLYAAGVRVSEAASLCWGDTEARGLGGQITIFGKGGKTRTILLGTATWRALSSLRGEAPSDGPVFRSRKGGHLDSSQIRRIVWAAARRAGLEKRVSPHWMRHAHASHALDRGAPVHLVQATLGHGSIATTGRYLHARPTDSSSLYLPD